MRSILYESLIIYCYFLFLFSIISIAYSIYKIFVKRKGFINFTKFILYFGYFMLITFLVIFIMNFLVKNNISIESNNIFIFLSFIMFFGTFGNLLVWIWSHWSLKICEDRFIYSHLFLGKETINFTDINIKESKYLFIFPKGKRSFGDDILYLKMYNQKCYRFNLNIFFRSGDISLMTNTIIFNLKIKREKVIKR